MRAVTRTGLLRCAVLLGLACAVLAAPGPASAHERRDVLNGKYRMTAGFLNEPTVEDNMNAAFLNVVSLTEKTADGKEKPIEGLEKTLRVEVSVGGGSRKKELALEPRSGMPGQYVANFIPSQAGDYTFRFFGTVGTDQINERFESGPGRFSAAAPLSDVQFPVPAAGTAGGATQDNTARALGIAGLVVGVLGLGAAAAALLRRAPSGAAGPAARRLSEGD